MAMPNVLVIEDDPYTIELYTRVLKRANYRVSQAQTVQEAATMIKENTFDLILCDMQLGTERTINMLAELSSAFEASGTDVVAISAEEKYRGVCAQIGVDFFLSKPVSIRALVSLVDRITVGKVERKIPLVLDTREMMSSNKDETK
jgi:two-component system, OmpR family, torCAD operon response regulator TorR